MQTITTKYIGPTMRFGSRIKASGGGQSVTVPYDYAMSDFELSAYAVTQLNKKLEWAGEMVGGSVADGYIWVFITDERITL